MLNNIPEGCVGFRVCTNCGELMPVGYYLNGDYACCDECGIALYGGDEEAFHRVLEEEQEDPGSTECFYTEWFDEREGEYSEPKLEVDSSVGYRFCANCGKKIHEGFNLDGECACSWDCAVALYGYDANALQRDLDKEKAQSDTTNCKWMKWDVYDDGMKVRTCYRILLQMYRKADGKYYQEERYFTRKKIAEREYGLICLNVDIKKEEWVLLEMMEFEERGWKMTKPRHSLLRFCGNWK